jgi:hypothetical protein
VQTGFAQKMQSPLFGAAIAPPLGTRPAKTAKPPARPSAPCYKQKRPDLNAARIGAGP